MSGTPRQFYHYRLRLADARGNVALAQACPDAPGDQDLDQGGMQRRLNRVHSAGLTNNCHKCQYRIMQCL